MFWLAVVVGAICFVQKCNQKAILVQSADSKAIRNRDMLLLILTGQVLEKSAISYLEYRPSSERSKGAVCWRQATSESAWKYSHVFDTG